MHYVGIDIAKRSHYAAVLDEDGNLIASAFPFDNTSQGFARLLMQLGKADVDCNDCMIGMEATGHYWVALFEFLTAHGFETVVINPIQTDAYRKVDTVRMTKTDPIDAELIADLLRVKEFRASTMGDEAADSLKQLTRYRMTLVNESTRLKNKATAIMDRIFPEYASLFVRPYGPTSKAVLRRCATPRQVIKMGVNRLTRILDVASNGRCGIEKAEAIIQAARTSVGVTFSSDALALEVRYIIERLDFLESQAKRLDGEIEMLLQETPGRWLITIPGIGTTLAAQITSEIGDAHRFSSASKLIAYAGMDATKYQSGERDDNGHMSKRGSAQLRYALIQAADGARKYDPYFGEYYALKLHQGAHYYLALSCVARKLAGVILSLMKEDRPYEPEPPAHHLPGHLLAAHDDEAGSGEDGDDDTDSECLG